MRDDGGLHVGGEGHALTQRHRGQGHGQGDQRKPRARHRQASDLFEIWLNAVLAVCPNEEGKLIDLQLLTSRIPDRFYIPDAVFKKSV